MRTASERIADAFQLINEVFDELERGDGVRWGDSIRETIDEAIRTYKRNVEKLDEKVTSLVILRGIAETTGCDLSAS